MLWAWFYVDLIPSSVIDSMGWEWAERLANGIGIVLGMLSGYLAVRRIGSPLTSIGVSLQQVYDAFDGRYEFGYEVIGEKSVVAKNLSLAALS